MSKKNDDPQAITIFYAWQDVSPRDTNRFFIRGALQSAIKRVSKANAAYKALRYDEATRGVPGSPLIIDAILGKIDVCAVFVGDISVINPTAEGERRVPNPNVVFETSWAAARVGWHRTILVLNKATGNADFDVPFDLRGRRLLTYDLPSAGARDPSTVRQLLEDDLCGALKTALESAPPLRPSVRARRPNALSPQQQRKRDSEALHQLLGTLDSQWLDRYLHSLGDERILADADVHYLYFIDVAHASRFQLFDRSIDRAVRDFADAWDRVYEVTRFGDAHPNLTYVRFLPEVYALEDKSPSEMHRELQVSTDLMKQRLAVLIQRLHIAFPEFDLHVTDKTARAVIDAL